MRNNSLKTLFDTRYTAQHIIRETGIEQLINNSKETDPKKTTYADISQIFDEFAPYTIAFRKGRYSIDIEICVENAEYNGEEKLIAIVYSEIRWKIGGERRNRHNIKGRAEAIAAIHPCLFGYIATEPFPEEAAEDISAEFAKATGEQLTNNDTTKLREYLIMCAEQIHLPYLLKN